MWYKMEIEIAQIEQDILNLRKSYIDVGQELFDEQYKKIPITSDTNDKIQKNKEISIKIEKLERKLVISQIHLLIDKRNIGEVDNQLADMIVHKLSTYIYLSSYFLFNATPADIELLKIAISKIYYLKDKD